MTLESFALWLDWPGTGPLLPFLQASLRERLGQTREPLRWAITAVEASESGGRRLCIEAVLLHLEA